jgi:hypothetical protein
VSRDGDGLPNELSNHVLMMYHNCTENTHLFNEEMISFEDISDVRTMNPEGNIEAFCFFFNDLVPCVAGRKIWTMREKANKLISEARKVVSVLDEAFTVLALKNYWKRWNNTGTAVWTDSRVGNYQYMGWADAAYVQFDALCKRIREQRQNAANMKLEQVYLARSRNRLAGGGTQHSRRLMGGQVETNMEVYNELDSDNEE